jgi:two-component system, NtrC family, nitrogen regulation response regulator GlnG
MPSLLVIDDEPTIHYSFRRVFEGDGVRVLTAATAEEGVDQVRQHDPDVVLLDLQLPDRPGLEVFGDIQRLDPRRPIIFITAHGTTDTAIEAMKGGAFDYLVKPIDLDRLSQILQRAFEVVRAEAPLPAAIGDDRDGRIVGRSPVIQEMCKAIGRLAVQDVGVLIIGESGTGKELVARALHAHSPRAGRPFLAINCAAIPDTLLESELFGYEQGAFSGASRRHQGKFEQCDGGTLLLDEIGDMSPAVQAKMLRVLQEQRFERLGGSEAVRTQVRVLAATNQDLESLVEQGRFRKDFYYRLKGLVIQVPPLRDRLADVPELAQYFLTCYNRELNRDVRGFAPEVIELFQRHDWPGNVRELQGVVKQAALQVSGGLITPELLPLELRDESVETTSHEGPDFDLLGLIESLLAAGQENLYDEVIGEVERILFTRVLRQTRGNQMQASELLGMNRATLRSRLRALSLTIDKVVSDDRADEEVDAE